MLSSCLSNRAMKGPEIPLGYENLTHTCLENSSQGQIRMHWKKFFIHPFGMGARTQRALLNNKRWSSNCFLRRVNSVNVS